MASYNIKRIEIDIEKNIPIIIQRELTDELVKSITITGCELTHDMSFCKVYFTTILDIDHKKIEKEVNEASPVIRGKLAKMMEIRNTPALRFQYDESIEYGNKIESIINKLNS